MQPCPLFLDYSRSVHKWELYCIPMHHQRKRQASAHSSNSLQLSLSHTPAVLPLLLDVKPHEGTLDVAWELATGVLWWCLCRQLFLGSFYFAALDNGVMWLMYLMSRPVNSDGSCCQCLFKNDPRHCCSGDVDHIGCGPCCGRPSACKRRDEVSHCAALRGQVSALVSPPHPTIPSPLSVLSFLPSQPLPLSW